MAVRQALVLAAVALLFAACRGGGGTGAPGAITLTGDELEAFAASLVLSRDDLPEALPDVQEGWNTEPSTAEDELLQGVTSPEAGWLGTYSRGFFIEGASGRTYTIASGVLVFESAEQADAAFDPSDFDVDGLGEAFLDTSSAGDYDVEELDLDLGDESRAVVLSGEAQIGDTTERLSSAIVLFRRGPVVVVLGRAGFLELDETRIRGLAELQDERITAALEGL